MLNTKQNKAILNEDRFVFLYAGAGTGKTTVMIEKIKHLINNGYAPESILALTFTKEAAAQMRRRLNIENVSLKTFHAWSFEHLKHLKLISEDVPFSSEYLKNVSVYKNNKMTSILPFKYKKYQAFLNLNKVVDYDDLLLLAIKEKAFNKTYSYILIDEFQDTNMLQLNLLDTLIKPETKVFAVGDPDQSIYGFRGAVPNVIQIFIKKYQAKTLVLSSNYRSYTYIIKLANHLMTHDKYRVKKHLEPSFEYSGKLIYKVFDTFKEEVNFIKQFIKTHRSDVAILCRTHQRMFDIKFMLFESFMFLESRGIQLLTIHQSKGLEFDHVLITGLEQNTIPGNHFISKEQLSEERRLLFVAITRARKTLCFSRVKIAGKPSQFLPELNVID
jgi:DNA helicase-2/ATP-dependent DNA helicase PcrA